MSHNKRKLVEGAIAVAIGLTGAQASAEVRTRIKRLLNADRALGCDLNPSGPAVGRRQDRIYAPAFVNLIGVPISPTPSFSR